MDIKNIRKKFPASFPVDLLPEGAKEENIQVYRICRTGAVERQSFLPTYLDELFRVKEIDEKDIGDYSLSTYEKARDARNRLKFFRGKDPCAIVAKGITDSSCGIVQRTKERTGQHNSHIDWWLYEGSEPHKHFQEVQLDEQKGWGG